MKIAASVVRHRHKRKAVPLVTEGQLAAAFGVDARTVRRWVADGLAATKRGRVLELDLGTAIRWVRDRDRAACEARVEAVRKGLGLDEARAQKVGIETQLAELKLKREQAGLVPADEVEARWSEIIVAIREAVMGLPGMAVQSGLIEPRQEVDLELMCFDALAALASKHQEASAAEAGA